VADPPAPPAAAAAAADDATAVAAAGLTSVAGGGNFGSSQHVGGFSPAFIRRCASFAAPRNPGPPAFAVSLLRCFLRAPRAEQSRSTSHAPAGAPFQRGRYESRSLSRGSLLYPRERFSLLERRHNSTPHPPGRDHRRPWSRMYWLYKSFGSPSSRYAREPRTAERCRRRPRRHCPVCHKSQLSRRDHSEGSQFGEHRKWACVEAPPDHPQAA
jgi:hypothetical protein